MNLLRWMLWLVLAVVVGLPLLALGLELQRLPSGWSALGESQRLISLTVTSLLLVAGTVALAMPLGLVGGMLLFRTELPGRRWFQGLFFLTLFVPLPLTATAWQMARSWLLATADTAWFMGLGPAILLHALIATPWVIILTGLGLNNVERELEEDALLQGSWWHVLWSVTLPRSLPALVVAALFAAMLAWNEITITDKLVVRTFAEEVYLQFVAGGPDETARAVATALPAVAAWTLLTLLLVAYCRRSWPGATYWLREGRTIPLGLWRWPAALLLGTATAVLLGVPLLGLVHKAGLRYATQAAPGPPTWDLRLLIERMELAARQQAEIVGQSLLLALLAGLLTATLALASTWLMRGNRWRELAAWLLVGILWAIPGPLIGIGLLDAIQWLITLPGGKFLAPLLYDRPSPWPNVWACMVRFLPLAFAALWPVARWIPRNLEELATLEGQGAFNQFRHVAWPFVKGAYAWTVLGVGVLTLGEISASKIVTTPDYVPLAHHVFMQMHASADTELAALCLLLLGLVTVGGVMLWLARGAFRGLTDRTGGLPSPMTPEVPRQSR